MFRSSGVSRDLAHHSDTWASGAAHFRVPGCLLEDFRSASECFDMEVSLPPIGHKQPPGSTQPQKTYKAQPTANLGSHGCPGG